MHHSIAQLYLRTFSSLDALPHHDTAVKTRSKRRLKRSHTATASMGLGKMDEVTPVLPTLSFGKSPTSTFQPHTLPALSSTDESSSSSSSSDSKIATALTSTQLRTLLAASMSSMYRTEVPLYGDLLEIISRVNTSMIAQSPEAISDDEISRLSVERHGAIRVGTPEELSVLARIFRVSGMQPVGYYDLWKDARLPIHATAFRPVGAEQLLKNPFRIFCSLLRMDLIEVMETRRLAEELLSQRQIASDRCLELLAKAESGLSHEGVVGGLTREEAIEFVKEVVDIFAWHPTSPATTEQYTRLSATHPLVADIVSFRGPHINHLTPRTLDIDAVQRTMVDQGMDAKEVVEGPPRREWEVLLRQTSFHALSERVRFEGGKVEGRHKARFGEIEARGMALTRRGARLYDDLMEEVGRVKKEREQRGERVGREECVGILERVFSERFPDTRGELMRQGLGYWMFSVVDIELARTMWRERRGEDACGWLADMVEKGALEAEPITYEDFLPASAAGIFQSNLPQAAQQPPAKEAETAIDEAEARTRLEKAVGGKILDYFALYSEQQRQSLLEVGAVLGVDVGEVVEMVERQSS